jgi:Domain of unknown function (DUF4158)
MPGQLFNDAERKRLGGYPSHVPQEDLVTFYTLTKADKAQVNWCTDDASRLGFALQLGTLRHLGFCPDDLASAPPEVVGFLADQLRVDPQALSAYGQRAQTRTDHFLAVQAYLGFRKPDPEERKRLARWLLDRALEHDRPMLLWQLACERLAADKVVRPGVTVLERIIVTARGRAEHETMRRVAVVLDGTRRSLLDGLLIPDEATGQTPLSWLRRGEVANTPAAILAALRRRATLVGWGVDRWDLQALHPNRLKLLARLGRRSTNQALQRAPAQRRYPILVAFLRQALEETTDEVIDLFDHCLARASARAERKLEEFRLATARTTDEVVRLFGQIGRIVLDPGIADRQVRAAIYRQVTPEALRATVERSEGLSRPADDHHFDFLADRYSYLRQFTPGFLDALPFRSNRAGAPILEAVALLRDLNARGQRRLPPETPVQFVPARWRPYVIDREGQIDRRYFELCTLWELRGALRAGNVWLETSRRFADPETYLIPREHWPQVRRDICRSVQLPEEGATRLQQRRTGSSVFWCEHPGICGPSYWARAVFPGIRTYPRKIPRYCTFSSGTPRVSRSVIALTRRRPDRIRPARSDSRLGFPAGALAATEPAAVIEERRPATSPLLHERLHPCRGAAVGGAGQQLGGQPRPPVLGLGCQNLGPVHAGGLQLFRPHVMAQRRLTHPVQVGVKPVVDLPVIEPPPRLGVHLGRAGLEQHHMPSVLERRHVLVERLPVVRDDDDPALGGEFSRNRLPLQAPRVRVPSHGFFLFGLAQALEQANPAPIRIESIDVINDHELITVPIELDVHAKRRGVALDPARLAVEHGLH